MSAELALVGRVVTLAQDPEVDLRDLVEAISTSPQLCADIVRVANSCLYGMEGKISRVDRATLILGVRPISEIAAGVLVASQLRGTDIGPLSGECLWLHSFEVAIAAELIARSLQLPCDAEAYLTGLLHDLGIPAAYEQYGPPYGELIVRARAEGRALSELEHVAWDECHAERIARLAEGWGLPQPICQALGAHESPSADDPLASVLAAAHALVGPGEAGWGDMAPPPSEGLAPEFEALGLLADDVEDIRALVQERLKEASAVY